MNNPLNLRLSLILLFINAYLLTHAQLTLDWALTQGSKESDLTSTCKMDSEGRIYTVGVIRDTTDLDPGQGEDLLYPPDPEALVLSKFETDGSYLWGNRMISNGEIGGSISQIKDDELLLIIYFVDSLVYIQQGQSSTVTVAPGQQICLLKMDTDGQITWIYNLQDHQGMYFSDLITLEDGSFLAAGSFADTVDFASAGGTFSIISNGGYDAFISRFDPNFTLEWITSIGAFGDDYMEKIFLQDEESIYFTLVHDSTIFLVTDEGINTFPAFGEDNNIYGIASLDGGSIQKAYSFGGALGDQLRSIAADDEGNMYISGYFEGTVNFQNPPAAPVNHTSVNGPDGFVAKYTEDGSLVWTRIFRDGDYGGLYTMSLEHGHELYLTGGVTEIADFDPGPDSNIVNTGHRGYIYTVKFDTDGDMKWLHYFPGNDFAGFRSLIVRDTNVILHGYYYDSLDCDPSVDDLSFISQGGSDMFLMSLTEDGVISSTGEFPMLNTYLCPNPTSDEVMITCERSIEQITIHTIEGSLLSVPVNISQKTASVNLRNLNSGMYVLKIKSGDQYSVTKVVKE